MTLPPSQRPERPDEVADTSERPSEIDPLEAAYPLHSVERELRTENQELSTRPPSELRMSSARPYILIATPCYGGLMTHIYVHSLLKLIGYSAKNGFGIGLFTAEDSLITRGRNALVTKFLEFEAATHLMFVDADIGFSPEQVHRLLELDEEVAAGMYPLKFIDWSKVRTAAGACASDEELREAGLHFVGVPCVGAEREDRRGFVTGQYAGTGFMLIKRSAITRMIAAYPETRYRIVHTAPAPKEGGPNLYNLFDCMIEPETGAYLSEDYTFCHRFRRIGGKVWLDTESRLRHVGSAEYQGCPAQEIMKYAAPAEGTVATPAAE